MSKGKVSLLLRIALLALPGIASFATYVVCDPFKVVRKYEFGDYFNVAAPVELNRDYVSFEIFSRAEPQQHFDALIFGSSRSEPFRVESWKKHLPPDARPFHYPAASETLYGVTKKMEYLDAHGVHLRFAIVELSRGLGVATPRYDVRHRLPPAISGESWLDFQGAMLKSYYTDFYFLKYMDYRVRGSVPDWGRDALGITQDAVHIDPATNEYTFASYDRELAADPAGYYEKRAAEFPPHKGAAPPCMEPVVLEPHVVLLKKLRAIFDKQGTDYRIVFMPDYGQECMAPADKAALVATMGEQHVFDFQGVNAYTATKENFYDPGHVKPPIAAKILDDIYRNTP